MDPISSSSDLLDFCMSNDVQFVAYSPLGTQHPVVQPGNRNPVLTSPIIAVSLFDITHNYPNRKVSEKVQSHAVAR